MKPSVLFSKIDIVDDQFNHTREHYVGVRDGFIDYVGADAPLDAYDETYDGRGKLLMPAFYNAHAHIPMTLLRGYAENLPLNEWLNDRVFPYEAKIDEEAVRAASDLCIAELVRFGCASFSDMYYFEEARCESVASARVKCNISRCITAFDAPGYNALPDRAINDSLFTQWDGACDGRMKVDMCFHAEYTNNPVVMREVAEETLARGSRLHVHVSETSSEVSACRERHGGLSPVQLMESLGIFEVPVIAAHCVWVDDDDISILSRRRASVALNPASNLKLASGFAPVAKMLSSQINLSLGTDGPASNNAQNMVRDTYLLATVFKASSRDAALVTPSQALRAATRGGALAQGRQDCGLIKQGMRADLTVLDVTPPWFTPSYDLLASVVYSACGSEVVLTMVDGTVVYKDGVWPTIDVERAKYETNVHAFEIADKVSGV